MNDDHKHFADCRCLRCVNARWGRHSHSEALIARENADLIARMRRGQTLARVDHQATWWPPRPIIKKDPHLVARALGDPEKVAAKLTVVE